MATASYSVLISQARHQNPHSASPLGMLVVPKKAMVRKKAESSACPTTVEPMVRVQRKRPPVSRFIRASTKELENSPTSTATKLPLRMRQVWPRIVS